MLFIYVSCIHLHILFHRLKKLGGGKFVGSDSNMPIFVCVSLSHCLAPNTESIPLLTWRKAQESVPWNIILLLGGGFAMAKGCEVCLPDIQTIVQQLPSFLKGLVCLGHDVICYWNDGPTHRIISEVEEIFIFSHFHMLRCSFYEASMRWICCFTHFLGNVTKLAYLRMWQ